MGGVLVLGVLAWILVERLWVRLDAVVMACLVAAVFIPLAQTLLGNPPTKEALFKHVSLCYGNGVLAPLATAGIIQNENALAAAGQVLAILLISLTIFKGGAWDGGTRHSGLFVNPNNLALIPFLLLFFIDPSKDKWPIRVAIHGIVIAVLAYTGTSGAVSPTSSAWAFTWPAGFREGHVRSFT